MKKFAAFMAIVVAVVFSAGLVVSADAPAKITIKEIQKTKPPVVFDHKAHTGKVKECKTCHHKGEAGKEEKCSKCHKAKAEGKTVELKEAFHKTCKDCHKKEKASTKCDDCHKK
jgi:uncharacterized paraquat-inducible protein A